MTFKFLFLRSNRMSSYLSTIIIKTDYKISPEAIYHNLLPFLPFFIRPLDFLTSRSFKLRSCTFITLFLFFFFFKNKIFCKNKIDEEMKEWSQFNRAWTTLLEIPIVFSQFHDGPGISCTDSSLLPFPIRSPPALTWRPAFPWCICAKNSVLSPVSWQNIVEISRRITKIYAMLYTARNAVRSI